MMTREEYDKWCEWLKTESPLKLPEKFVSNIISNYWLWSSHTTLARLLKHDSKFEPALRLMETVVEQGPEDESHYAWALSDLGYLYWRVFQVKEKAIHYLREALNVLDTTEQNYNEMEFFSSGGRYLRTLLEILYVSGDVEEAKKLAHVEINRYKQKYSNVKKNSYIYETYLFLADLEHREGDCELAIEFMKMGLSASEFAEETIVLCSQKHESLEQLYNKLIKLSRSLVLHFEV